MALNDGEGGDIGFIYFSNLQSHHQNLNNLPILDEKLKFTEFKALQLLGRPNFE